MKVFNITGRSVFIILIVSVFSFLLSGCGSKDKVLPQFDSENYSKHVRITVKDYGTMEFALLEGDAPATTESFISLAENGFFDEKPIYMVIEDFCMIGGVSGNIEGGIASGDPQDGYYPFRGSLCITETGTDGTVGSFTVIGTTSEFLDNVNDLLNYRKITSEEYYKQAYGTDLDDETLDLFRKYGGAPWLYGHCTVFGQMISGEDVLDRIMNTPVYDDAGFKPMQDIIIESVAVY